MPGGPVGHYASGHPSPLPHHSGEGSGNTDSSHLVVWALQGPLHPTLSPISLPGVGAPFKYIQSENTSSTKKKGTSICSKHHSRNETASTNRDDVSKFMGMPISKQPTTAPSGEIESKSLSEEVKMRESEGSSGRLNSLRRSRSRSQLGLGSRKSLLNL